MFVTSSINSSRFSKDHLITHLTGFLFNCGLDTVDIEHSLFHPYFHTFKGLFHYHHYHHPHHHHHLVTKICLAVVHVQTRGQDVQDRVEEDLQGQGLQRLHESVWRFWGQGWVQGQSIFSFEQVGVNNIYHKSTPLNPLQKKPPRRRRAAVE